MLHNVNSYICLLVYILFWALTFYIYYRKVRFTTGTIIMLSYLIYGVLAYFLYDNAYYGHDYEELTLFPFIYLYGMLYVFLIPIFKYEKRNVIYVKTPSNHLVKVFIVVYAICSLITLPSTIASLQEGLTILFLDSYGGTELYREAQENVTARESGIAGIYGLFAIVHNIFSDVALFVISYYLTTKNKNKYLLLLLAVVIIADLLYPLSKGARTDLVMKFFAIIMTLSIFYPYYSRHLKHTIKKVFIVIALIICIPFMAMTISRFAERDGGTAGGMLSYIAQAPLNFNNHVLDNGGIRNGDRTINLFKQFAGMNPPEGVGEVRAKYFNHKIDDGLFSTYVGDFVLDFGPLATVVIFVILSSIFYRIIRIRRKTISFHSLIIIYFIACVAMQGGMYLFYYSFMQNLQILAFMFIYVLFYIDSKNQKSGRYLIKNEYQYI